MITELQVSINSLPRETRLRELKCKINTSCSVLGKPGILTSRKMLYYILERSLVKNLDFKSSRGKAALQKSCGWSATGK